MRSLLKKGAQVNQKDSHGWTALIHASAAGRPDVIRALIKAKADVNAQDKDGNTALMIAGMFGHRKAVETLLQAKADPNLRDKEGLTVLMKVCVPPRSSAPKGASTSIAKSLLQAKADPNLMDNLGHTALTIAKRSGQTEIVKALKAAGASPESP